MHHTSVFHYLLFAIVFCLLISACENVFNEGYTTSRSYFFQKDRQIAVDTSQQVVAEDSTQTLLHARIEAGDKLVFIYKFTKNAPPNIADGDFSESIRFAIPTGSNSFDFEDSELTTIPAFYDRGCFCPIIGSLKITKGYLRGEQLSEHHWVINASLETSSKITDETFEVSFSDVFVLSQSNN